MATPRKTPVKTTPEPGPKPDYHVVEDHLKCQTSDGEISIDLRIPLEKIELFMDIGDLDIDQRHFPRYLIDNILHAEDKAKLEGMRDGAKAIAIVAEFARQVGARMGADMGESSGSTASSESTVEPSATTSDTDSE
jgi:hypothetical protein